MPNKVWTESEKQFIRENAGTMYDKDLAVRLSELTGRKINLPGLRRIRQVLGVKKKHGRGKCELVGSKKEKAKV